MDGVEQQAFEYALKQITDGFVFEKFANDYLSKLLGYDFLPVGGLKDRGIDSLEHLFHRNGHQRHIYQISIEKNPQNKLRKTFEVLKKNRINYDQLCFVTNQIYPEIDKSLDELFLLYKKPLRIFDLKWLSTRVNTSQATVTSFRIFVESYLHEFAQPGKSYLVADLQGDPRLYVFLRQQWEQYRNQLTLDEILADTLILFCLEGTDPDKGLFKTKQEIHSAIGKFIKYDPKLLSVTIDKRVDKLIQRPRRIQYHSGAKAYCLPYETRLRIQERNLRDAQLYEQFNYDLQEKLRTYLHDDEVPVDDCLHLVHKAINFLFYQQGIEFADFVLNGENQDSVEKRLDEIISSVVDESPVPPRKRENLKTALLVTIRDTVYNGTPEQKYFLRGLSSTYMMLFLLKCDPKICTFFRTMASKLHVYVCTSIIVPAMSEYYLESVNRRHWNLLKGASQAGVTLVVNQPILSELAAHLRMVKKRYEEEYRADEAVYLSSEMNTLYIDEIMIRAYFYAKMRGLVNSFDQLLDNFVDPQLDDPETELVEWLKDEFRVQFVSDKSTKVKIDANEERELESELITRKLHTVKARTDARIILTIYGIRELNNETSKAGIFGYQTWWLSKDVTTFEAVNKLFKEKYKISCYIRPDFLYNYISLSPNKTDIDSVYEDFFPSLLGVNISFHLPKDVYKSVHRAIAEHRGKNASQLKRALRQLTDRLKTDHSLRTASRVEHFLDSKLGKFKHRKRKRGPAGA